MQENKKLNVGAKPNYKRTLFACYLGFITQAIAANFAPLLFLKFHADYGITLSQLASISIVFFITQLVVDAICAKYVDVIGYRTCIIVAEATSALGFIGLAFLPDIMANPLVGVLLGVVVYATGCGIVEVVCSPIVEATPSEHKEATMSLLHSFYCWGSVFVIAVSTAFFALFGLDSWKILACIWAIIPLYNIYNFAICPIEQLNADGSSMTISKLLCTPLFWLTVVLMISSGASELAMAQWASAFAESALGLTKAVGDLVAPCLFAVAMGICRIFYGKYGMQINLVRFMFWSGVLCLGCYLLATLVQNPIINLVGCIVCGFSCGIMWPGTLSISAKYLPLGGTAMFAFLAMAGDCGAALGPVVVGRVAQLFNDDLKCGLLASSIFPVVLIIAVVVLYLVVVRQRKAA